MTRLEMSIRLVLSESSRNGDVNGSRFRRGEKGRKKKIRKEKDGGEAEYEGDDEEMRGEDQGMDVFTLYPLFF